MIYFDNSATTRPLDEVVQQVAGLMAEPFANPASLHRLGLDAERERDRALDRLATAAGCRPDELLITSGGTESINTALRGYLAAHPRSGKHILSSEGEHPAVLNTLEHLSENGYDVTLLPLEDQGCVSLDRLADAIRPDTALLTLFHMNNETGAVHPVDALTALRDRVNPGMAIHLDGVQSFGKIRPLPGGSGCELYSFSGHKLHAPKGVGGLYIRSGTRMEPLLYGGGQQRGLRSGTENIPLLSGLALAAERAVSVMDKTEETVRAVRETVLKVLDGTVPFSVLSPHAGYPGILNLSFPDLNAETMLHALEMDGVFVSTGAACSSRARKHSPVLQSMGIRDEVAASAVRFSFSRFNTTDEAQVAAEAVTRAIERFSSRRRKK